MAIKRLQAKGVSLANLQQRLLGLSDAEIAEIARLPAIQGASEQLQERRSGSFWTEPPAPVEKREPAAVESPLPLQGVQLSDNVTLLLHPSRALEPDDLEAIRGVAAPMLKLLEMRRLI